ncbi:MAG: hypothetical protein QME74_05890, partial [Candidatus Edwardsbacteria bacterium]|nr:hypothetical protein [Candidatus Edwardsbacteria bacterium]
PGQEMHFDRVTKGFEISYVPNFPIKTDGGTVNEFSTAVGDGMAALWVDAFENRLNGRFKGVIKYAKLYGYFMIMDTGERVPPKNPAVLELYNWSFDVRLGQSPFYR